MQLEDDPLAMLGRPYALVRSVVSGTDPRSVSEDRAPGEPDELFAEAPDGRWQCVLDADGRLESIFLFGDKGCRFPLNLRPGMSVAEAQAEMGEPPTRSKPERAVPGFGWAGAFLRWDKPTHCLHAEFGRDGGLRQLTFMVPSRAP